MARRFIIDRKIELNEAFDVLGEEAKHIFVLRHNVGDEILVNDKWKCPQLHQVAEGKFIIFLP